MENQSHHPVCALLLDSTAAVDTNWGPDGPEPVDSELMLSHMDQYGQMGSDMLQVRGKYKTVGQHVWEQLKDIIVVLNLYCYVASLPESSTKAEYIAFQ